MRIKYLRVSTLNQTGNRFEVDKENYDLVLFDKISGVIPFRERPEAKKLIEIIESGQEVTLIVDEISRLGRTTSDTIQMMDYFDKKDVTVIVKNLGIQSRTNQKKNPIWNLIIATMSSLNQLELESIKERTMAGRQVYVARGGVLGRKTGTTESIRQFIEKPKSKKILEYLEKGWTLREIAKQVDASTKTVMKVKSTATKLQMI
ncbi:MAG: recombinase family protein [Bacteroidia bacterium]|jgi:DNA invertase Pin-like site-specific DNA recombinase|nr:recombinase family protein [Bacteroidia bacterium]